ncbi:MAG TPA: lytic transglycosylase domain-containing protein [Vicinamibacterales bacterium]|nr:lytic transglycosylase domain-containing protein [Vicinamibacterales bacterium]
MFRYLAAAATLCVLTPSPARAQIYSWKDASGRLVMSDTPKDPSAKVYSVGSGAFAVTKPAARARTTEYDALITQHATAHALNPDFVRAVVQAESAFNPRARSTKGAMGLMQLMPATALEYRVANAYDPEQNIRAGVAYLKSLLTHFNNDVSLALAAYNAGPGAVEKYGRTVPPYKETRSYVARIRNASSTAASPNQVFQTVQIIDGQRVVRFTNKPRAGSTVVATVDAR